MEQDATSRRIEEVDKLISPPAGRALRVFHVLAQDPTLTDWDVVCFCAEFLGLITPSFTFLEKDARALNSIVYTAHYYNENWSKEITLRIAETPDQRDSKDQEESQDEDLPKEKREV